MPMIPGEIIPASKEITLNAGRRAAQLKVANTGDRPIQVGSHYHFFEANRRLAFDRAAAYGMRLDVPSGTSVRFEPGETKTVGLVALGGRMRVHGLNGLTEGQATGATLGAALERARLRGFLDPQAAGKPAGAAGKPAGAAGATASARATNATGAAGAAAKTGAKGAKAGAKGAKGVGRR